MSDDDFDGLSLVLWVLGLISVLFVISEVLKNGGGIVFILAFICAIFYWIYRGIKHLVLFIISVIKKWRKRRNDSDLEKSV